jgi:hypothetical protein
MLISDLKQNVMKNAAEKGNYKNVFFKKSKPLEKSSEICLKYSLEI